MWFKSFYFFEKKKVQQIQQTENFQKVFFEKKVLKMTNKN